MIAEIVCPFCGDSKEVSFITYSERCDKCKSEYDLETLRDLQQRMKLKNAVLVFKDEFLAECGLDLLSKDIVVKEYHGFFATIAILHGTNGSVYSLTNQQADTAAQVLETITGLPWSRKPSIIHVLHCEKEIYKVLTCDYCNKAIRFTHGYNICEECALTKWKDENEKITGEKMSKDEVLNAFENFENIPQNEGVSSQKQTTLF